MLSTLDDDAIFILPFIFIVSDVISLEDARKLEKPQEINPGIEVDANDPDEQPLTPQEMEDAASKERKTINSFIKKGTLIMAADAADTLVYVPPIKVISEKQFEEQDSTTDVSKNEYVYFPQTGIYMQIVREGVGEKLKSGENATILCRYTEVNVRGDSIQTSNQNIYYTAVPDKMTVSNTLGTFTGSFVSGVMYSTYGSASTTVSVPSGWLFPLTYIRIGRQDSEDGRIARVRLILPDAQGQQDASKNVYACFYDITYQRGYK